MKTINIPYGHTSIDVAEADVRMVQEAVLLDRLTAVDIRVIDAILSALATGRIAANIAGHTPQEPSGSGGCV